MIDLKFQRSNIYIGVDILALAKFLNFQSKNFENFAEIFLKLLLNKVGKSGTVVVPVFNFDCVSKKFDRKNSVGQSGMFGNLLLKFYKLEQNIDVFIFSFWKKFKIVS